MNANMACVAVLLAALTGMAAGCGNGQTGDGGEPEPAVPSVSTDQVPGLSGPFAPQASMYPFTGDKARKLVHRSGCPLVGGIASRERVFFRGYLQGKNQGFKPCPRCRPDR